MQMMVYVTPDCCLIFIDCSCGLWTKSTLKSDAINTVHLLVRGCAILSSDFIGTIGAHVKRYYVHTCMDIS